ncbi:MAG TPA: T9SS type A sorting domain-containing protein [Cytophagaceae bacterium]
MKKQLLTAFACMLTLSFTNLHAQTFTDGETSYVQDVGPEGTSCAKNGTSGYLAQGNNIQSSSYSSTDEAIVITHKATINLEAAPGWWSLLYTNTQEDICDFMNSAGGVDLSDEDNQIVCITAKATVAGKYKLFLGYSAPSTWGPDAGNTYSDNIEVELDLTTDLDQYSINLNGTGFEELSYNTSINTYTLVPTDENQGGSIISITRIGLGKDVCPSPVTGVTHNFTIAETFAYVNAEGMINVKGVANGNYEYKILSTQGLELLSGKAEANMGQFTINSGNLSKGIYLLSCVNENGVKSTFKVAID